LVLVFLKVPGLSFALSALLYSKVWVSDQEGYLKILQYAKENNIGETHLPIHPYFKDPRPENDITIAELTATYLEYEVLGVGETLVDFIATSQSTSLRTAEEFQRFLGGQPANVAVYASLLGSRSAVLSKIGEGRFGEFVEESLQYLGVSTNALLKTDQLPTTSVFLTKTTGVPDFQVNRGADSLLTIRETPEELIMHSRAVHTSCFALSMEPS